MATYEDVCLSRSKNCFYIGLSVMPSVPNGSVFSETETKLKTKITIVNECANKDKSHDFIYNGSNH